MQAELYRPLCRRIASLLTRSHAQNPDHALIGISGTGVEHGVYVTKNRKKRAFLHFITMWEDKIQFYFYRRSSKIKNVKNA